MRVVLAGVDGSQKVKWVETGLPARPDKIHLLTSIVQHLKQHSDGAVSLQRCLESMNERLGAHDVMLDSGAHSFHQRYRRGAKIKLDEARRFRDRYVETILRSTVRPDYTIELDLQLEFGLDEINRWRDDVWRPLAKETGVEIIYVWSPVDGWQGYKDLAARPEVKYLGVAAASEIMRSGSEEAQTLVRNVCVAAFQQRLKTHLFKATSIALMSSLPVYSADSISWKSAALWGLTLFRPEEGRLTFTRIGLRQEKNAKEVDQVLRSGLKADWFTQPTVSGSKRAVLADAFLVNLRILWTVEREMTALWKSRGVDWDEVL